MPESVRLPGLAGGEIPIPGDAPLTLLVFFKSSCPTCRWALPFVQALHEHAAGLTVVGVAEDDEDEARELADELGLTFPIALESAPWSVSAAWDLTTVPTVFLVEDETVTIVSPGFSRDDLLFVARRAAARSRGAPVDPFGGDTTIPIFRPG